MLAIAGCAGSVALGNWQTQRAEARRAAEAQFTRSLAAPAVELPAHTVAPGEYAMRKVRVRGSFVPEHLIYLDNRIHGGRVGYQVVMPMRLAASRMHVLVNRGWIAAGARRDVLPVVATPAEIVTVEGLALAGLPQYLETGDVRGDARVRQNLVIDDVRRRSGLELQPLVIEQLSPLADGLNREWTHAWSGARKNEMYAMQWYSLAALSVVLFIVLSFRRNETAAR